MDNNYSFTYVPGTLTIGKKQLTVTANDAPRRTARPTLAVRLHLQRRLRRDRHRGRHRHAPDVHLDGDHDHPGRDRPDHLLGRPWTQQLQLHLRAGALTVDPKALTISATDQSKTYGSLFTFDTSDPSLHFDVVGLVNADAVASVTLSSTGAAASASVAGSPYPIVIGGALGTGLDNYDITYENAELTVDPKALTISATDQSKTYGSLFTFDTSDPSLHFTSSAWSTPTRSPA